ncbi:TnsA-like heteromeric transposase endonuclease subunit [Williamsia maris]|nr:TnsA-like heteromeric transposase endonuclease subunit [Williamsia maris]
MYVDPDTRRSVRRPIRPDELGAVAFESFPPIRRFPAYKGKRSHEGSYWFSGTGSHVRFESHFESIALMLLDFSQQVQRVSSNPFWLLWPKGLTPARHAPDFFARTHNGSVVLVDVHPAALISEQIAEQHLRTRRVCEALGWSYHEFTAVEPVVQHNVSLLAGYSRPRSAPPPAIATIIRSHVPTPSAGGITVADLLDAAHDATGLSHHSISTAVYHMLWRRQLHTNLQRPLTSDAKVWR